MTMMSVMGIYCQMTTLIRYRHGGQQDKVPKRSGKYRCRAITMPLMRQAMMGALFVYCALLSGTASFFASAGPSLPLPAGSYGVGRIGYELIDMSRSERLSSKPGARRRMMVYVRYPTDNKPGAGVVPAPYLPG